MHSWNPHLVQVSYNCWWPLSRRWLLRQRAVRLWWYTHSPSRSKPRRPSGPWRLRTRVHCTDRSGNQPLLEGPCKNCCPLWTPGWYPAEISITRWIMFRFQIIFISTLYMLVKVINWNENSFWTSRNYMYMYIVVDGYNYIIRLFHRGFIIWLFFLFLWKIPQYPQQVHVYISYISECFCQRAINNETVVSLFSSLQTIFEDFVGWVNPRN